MEKMGYDKIDFGKLSEDYIIGLAAKSESLKPKGSKWWQFIKELEGRKPERVNEIYEIEWKEFQERVDIVWNMIGTPVLSPVGRTRFVFGDTKYSVNMENFKAGDKNFRTMVNLEESIWEEYSSPSLRKFWKQVALERFNKEANTKYDMGGYNKRDYDKDTQTLKNILNSK